jgi:competence protein ComEC
MNPSLAGHRAPALWLLLPLLAGLVAGRTLASPLPVAGLLTVAAASLLVAGVWRTAWSWALPLGVFATALVLHDLARNRLPEWAALPPREARLEIEVTRVFGPSLDGARLNGLARVTGTEPHLAELAGQRVYFSLRPSAGHTLPRGVRVAALGVLEPLPPAPAPNTFEHYLEAGGVHFRFRRGVVLRETKPPSAYRRVCEAALGRFEAILRAGLADKDELGGVYRAMLLGRKSELTDAQDDLFLRSGTLHLFAISGLHIATIATALHVVLALIPCPRWLRFAVATVLLWLYTDITGGSPSAVRAFIMATVLASLPVLRLPGNTPAALACSALLVLALDPLQAFGAGFQMSYGIVAALLLLGLPLADAWLRRPTTEEAVPRAVLTPTQRFLAGARRAVVTSACLGLAATTVGTVTGIAFFQLFTPGAFFANLLLIPLASLVVVAGCASLVCGFAGLVPLSIVFNHAAALLLWAIEHVVQLVVRLPGASIEASFRAPWLGPATLGVLLGLFLHGRARGWRPEAGGFWPPFAAVALVLALGVRYGG